MDFEQFSEVENVTLLSHYSISRNTKITDNIKTSKSHFLKKKRCFEIIFLQMFELQTSKMDHKTTLYFEKPQYDYRKDNIQNLIYNKFQKIVSVQIFCICVYKNKFSNEILYKS